MNFNEVPYTYPTRSVVVDGFRVAYVDVNPEAGDPVVFLHDLGGDLDDFAALYEPASRVRRVVGIDLVGFGKSDKPPLDEPIALYVRLLGELLDAIEVERAALVGHGLGGLVAAAFAVERPERVTRLVLSAPDGVCSLDRQTRSTAAARCAFDHVSTLDDAGRRAWYGRRVAGWNDRLEAYVGVRNELAASLGFRPWARAVEAVSAAALDANLSPRLSEISVPTLVVWGGDDPVTSVANAAAVRDAIPGARLVTIEECGHMPAFEQPDAFSAAVVAFLDEAEVGAGDVAELSFALDVEPWPGLTPAIGRFALMLFGQRDALARLAGGLSIANVSWRPVPGAPSLGDLIVAAGGRTAWWLYDVLRGERVPEVVCTQFGIEPEAGRASAAAPPTSAGRLLADLTSVHEHLAAWLALRTDADLARGFTPHSGGTPVTLRLALWSLVEETLVLRGRAEAARAALDARQTSESKVMIQTTSSDSGSLKR